jgi:peptide/nickel transport system ATP-binding protein
MTDTSMILQGGAVVETSATARVFGDPMHPQTKMLLASVPQLHKKWKDIGARLATPPAGDRAKATAGLGEADANLVKVLGGHIVVALAAGGDALGAA